MTRKLSPLRWFLFWLMAVTGCQGAFGSQAITLDVHAETAISLRPENLELLLDQSVNQTPEAIAARWAAGEFSPATDLNLGLQRQGVWARLELKNTMDQPTAVVLSHHYAPTDLVVIRQPRPDGSWHERRSGDLQTTTSNERPRTPSFLLQLPAQSATPVFLFVETQSNLNFDMSVYAPNSYNRVEQSLALIYGALFGAVLISAFYLVLSAIMVRSRLAIILGTYLALYASYVGFLMGYVHYALPDAFTPYTNQLHMLSLALLMHQGSRFYRAFLDLAHKAPIADKLVAGLQWLALGLAFLHDLPPLLATLLSLVVIFIGPLLTTGLALYLWHRKVKQAGVFTLGWVLAPTAAILNTLRVNGLLPNMDWLLHLPAIGLLMTLAFFSYAVLRRFSLERDLVFVDPLTGLLNRRGLDARAADEFERRERFSVPLTLLVLDIDHFKVVNDTHGHGVGDQILQALGDCLTRVSRELDLVARLGGEEFAILCVQTDLRSATVLAERLRQAVGALHVAGQRFTISIGVAPVHDSDRSIWDTLVRADSLMYQAKHEGRNRVVAAGHIA
jgi:diguanylate cyclase (GGDEF)-like protein